MVQLLQHVLLTVFALYLVLQAQVLFSYPTQQRHGLYKFRIAHELNVSIEA